jgi:lanthanide-dependent methanol dehydrogenase
MARCAEANVVLMPSGPCEIGIHRVGFGVLEDEMTQFVNVAGAARVLAVASLICSVAQAQTPQPPSFAKATDDGQWTMPAKDVASTRYSSLDEINAQNAKNLKVAFAFSTGLDRGEEAAPLVVGDTM